MKNKPRKLKDYLPFLRELGALCKKHEISIDSKNGDNAFVCGEEYFDDRIFFYTTTDGTVRACANRDFKDVK